MTMISDSEKLNPQYNQNSVLTMPWIAWGGGPGTTPDPPLATGLSRRTSKLIRGILHENIKIRKQSQNPPERPTRTQLYNGRTGAQLSKNGQMKSIKRLQEIKL